MQQNSNVLTLKRKCTFEYLSIFKSRSSSTFTQLHNCLNNFHLYWSNIWPGVSILYTGSTLHLWPYFTKSIKTRKVRIISTYQLEGADSFCTSLINKHLFSTSHNAPRPTTTTTTGLTVHRLCTLSEVWPTWPRGPVQSRQLLLPRVMMKMLAQASTQVPSPREPAGLWQSDHQCGDWHLTAPPTVSWPHQVQQTWCQETITDT